MSGTNLFAGTYGGGILLSTNSGASWTPASTGFLLPLYVYALAIAGTNLVAGTGSGVWSRPLSEMVTSVQRQSTHLPTQFSLDQNYPNPFNPATTMSFVISHQSFVTLKVYDMLGEQVATLVNEVKQPGEYTVRWNAASATGGLPSGVYFYRLQAGSFTETKKLLLIR